MTTTILVLALLTALSLTAAGRAGDPPPGPVIAQEIVGTWACEDQLHQPRTKARSPWKHHSRAYWNTEYQLWRTRHTRCLNALHAHDATIRSLQHGLAGTPMEGTAGPLEAAGRRWGISPYFIAAIAGTESSFGAQSCSGNPYNAFGLSSCTTGWAVPRFRSWAQAYAFMARFLSSRWPGATTPWSFTGYAACTDCWASKVAMHMRLRFGVGPQVRYAR